MQRLALGSVFALCAYLISHVGADLQAADGPPDSQAAKLTRDTKLKAKISVDSSDGSGLMLREIIEEINSAVKEAKVDGKKVGGVRIKPDPKAGITLTTRIKFKSDKEPLEVVLDKVFEASGRPWGYYVNVSAKKDDQDDGAIIIVADPTCRGYPPGDSRNKKPDTKKEEPKKSK